MATGKNDVKNVSTTRGVKGGYVFSAPEGTPIPTDIATPLSDDFECAGFVSEDGFTEALDGSSENINDMNGDSVDQYSESRTETLALTLIEMSQAALSAQYGHKNVSKRDGMLVIEHDWSKSDETRVYVLELVLKNDRRWRKVIPAGKTSELGEFSGNSTSVAGREVTISYNVTQDNLGCYDYIEDTDEETPVAPDDPKPETPETPTKTLEEMTVDELKAYAAENQIDISGKTTKADILAAIKEAESYSE